MIIGEVTSGRNAVVRVEIMGSGDVMQALDAILDTGFNGEMTLPPEMAARLGLEALGHEQVILATGERRVSRTFRARIRWARVMRDVLIIEAAEPQRFGHDPRKLVEYYIDLQKKYKERLVERKENGRVKAD